MNLENVGKFIKYLRVKRGLTQEELANKINVTNKAISRWECGNGLPDTSLLEPLSKELNITISELLNGEYINNKDLLKNNTKSNVFFKHLSIKKFNYKNFSLILLTAVILGIIYYFNYNFYGFDNSYFIKLKNNFSCLPFSNILALTITKNYILFFNNILINCVIGVFISLFLIIFNVYKINWLIISNFLFELIKWIFFLAIFDIDDIFIRIIVGFLISRVYLLIERR